MMQLPIVRFRKLFSLKFKIENHLNFIGINNNKPNRFISTTSRILQQQNAKEEGQYRYTTNDANGKLSKEQRDFYEENGYLIIPKLVSDQDLDRYLQRFEDLANGRIEPSPLLMIQKDVVYAKEKLSENVCYKVQELYADDVLFEYCSHPSILDYVEAFVGGPDIMAIHSMLINKCPDFGKKTTRHPMHQDAVFFPLKPADRIVATWTAMEKITKDNGCLSAIPGSHKGEYLEHDYPEWGDGVNKLYYGIKNMSPELLAKRVHLPMERGDCIFFHPILIHGSGMNRTKGYRKAISCHYASAKHCYYIDVMGTEHDKSAKEILEIFQKRVRKYGMPEEEVQKYKYEDVWKFRSRLVRGTMKEGLKLT